MAGLGGIKGILFDKDGTLVDFEASWFAVADLLAMRAADGDRGRADGLLKLVGYDFDTARFLPDCVFAAGTNDEIAALWYPQATAEQRIELLKDFDRFIAESGAFKPVGVDGLEAALTALHAGGVRLAVATNDSTAGAESTLRAIGAARFFDAVYGFDAVANPKPAADTVQVFCDFTQLKPSELAVVGDNRHDLAMARAGGVGLAIGVLSGTGTRESLEPLADVVLGSVADLPGYLAGRVVAEARS